MRADTLNTFFALLSVGAVVMLLGYCGGYPKVVDEVPPEEPAEEVADAPQVPAQFVTADTVFKHKKNCFKLVPGGGVLTLVGVDCP